MDTLTGSMWIEFWSPRVKLTVEISILIIITMHRSLRIIKDSIKALINTDPALCMHVRSTRLVPCLFSSRRKM